MMLRSSGRMAELERLLHLVAAARASWSVLIVLLLVQLLVAAGGGVEAMRSWFETYGVSRDGVSQIRLWQLLTHGILHGSWWHVGLNGFLLLWIGARVEHIFGAAMALWVMAVGTVAGGLAHLISSSHLLVGASGAVFALMVFLATLSPDSRMLAPSRVSAWNLTMGVLLVESCLLLIDPGLDLPGLAAVGRLLDGQGMGGVFRISHSCHLAGAAAGWLMARWVLRPRVSLDELQRDRARRQG